MNVVRKAQTAMEFSRLKSEIEEWHKRRVGADTLRQYETQLNALKKLLDDAAGFLENQLMLLDTGQPVFELYEQCRLFDLRVLWLRKLWDFYREKFDQRDDDRMKNVLLAADEVVWSCFHQVFIGETKKRPAPLPFIEASYSPVSFPSELVPYNLKPSETGILQDLINRLPIPLVSLPQSCIQFPWQLVYIGHEIGHHIQYALLDNQQLVGAFQEQIHKIILGKTGDEDYAKKWSDWGKEIFADVFSVAMMGNWAVWAMVEFETQKSAVMLVRRSQYPSPVVRLALLKTAADKFGMNGLTAIRGWDLVQMVQGNNNATLDLSCVEEIVNMSLDPLPVSGQTIESLASFWLPEFEPTGLVDNLAADLKNGVKNITGNLRMPRMLACAAFAVWAEATEKDEINGDSIRQTLAENTLDLIIKSRPEGERNAAPEIIETTDLGRELSDLLLTTNEYQLEI